MICHRLMHAYAGMTIGSGVAIDETTQMWGFSDKQLFSDALSGCIGSVCSQWTPQVTKTEGCATWTRLRAEDDDGEWAPTDLGVCESNRSAIPWPDPATPDEKATT